MSAKHEPGPWRVFEHSWCETSITAPGTPNSICLLDINHATEESQEADEALMAANARLIAAAPDLLDALIACISGEFATTDKAALAKADAAIARATEESA